MNSAVLVTIFLLGDPTCMLTIPHPLMMCLHGHRCELLLPQQLQSCWRVLRSGHTWPSQSSAPAACALHLGMCLSLTRARMGIALPAWAVRVYFYPYVRNHTAWKT